MGYHLSWSPRTSGKPVKVKQRHRDAATRLLDNGLYGSMPYPEARAVLAAALAEAESSAERVCKRVPLDGDRPWFNRTTCGQVVELEDHAFCPFCGGRIEVEEAR